MKIRSIIAIIFTILFIVLLFSWLLLTRSHSNALWQIVSQQCIPNQQENHHPSPCLKVNLADGYVLFKDRKGPYHDLLIPTRKTSGIEDPQLQAKNSAVYFYQAWQNRDHLSKEFGKPLSDKFLALTINSQYGRSQNQLHIHISCLNTEVYSKLRAQENLVGEHWTSLPEKISGHQYMARKLADADFSKEDPFKFLQQYVKQKKDKIGNYGLAVTKSTAGKIMLLANRVSFLNFNFGSTEELLDYQCAVAH